MVRGTFWLLQARGSFHASCKFLHHAARRNTPCHSSACLGPGIRELTVEIPTQALREAANQPEAEASSKETASAAAVRRAQDDYVLGGYAGI